MHWSTIWTNSLAIWYSATAKFSCFCIEYFCICTIKRNTDRIIFSKDRLEVAYDNNFLTTLIYSSEAYAALCIVIVRNPIKAFPREINLPERTILKIEMVNSLKVFLELIVCRIACQHPIKLCCVIPFLKLTKFSTHKDQLLAWVSHHICYKGTNSCKLLFVAAWHFIDKRSLSMNNFIVRNRKNEVFRESIVEWECKIIVIKWSIKWVKWDIM